MFSISKPWIPRKKIYNTGTQEFFFFFLVTKILQEIHAMHTNKTRNQVVPFNLRIKKDLPDPHLAYRPTAMGMDSEGSLRMSASDEEYRSYPSMFSLSSLVFRRPEEK